VIHNLTDLLHYGEDNAVGELLRDVTFTGDGYGCYSTFEVRSDAREWHELERTDYWRARHAGEDDYIEELASEEAALGSGYTYTFANHRIDVCWYWDGDGHLEFLVYDPDGDPMRRLYNTDCKNAYHWDSEEVAA
jgi:hypothetical protein